MKETKIAKENVKNFVNIVNSSFKIVALEHKQTCQRWLEFLILTTHPKVSKAIGKRNFFGDKIKDLKQAIKLYGEAGI